MSNYDLNKVMKIGTAGGRGSVYSSKMILSDGYLVEPRPPLESADKDGKVTFLDDGFNLIAISLMSTKARVEEFLKLVEEEDLQIQKPGRSEFKTGEDAYLVRRISRKDAFHKPLSQLDTDQITRTGVSVTIEGPEKAVANVLFVVRPQVESNVRIRGGNRARFSKFGNERELAVIRERCKIEGCTIKDYHETIEGSLFKRCLFINPKCRPDDLDGDSKEAYLIGRPVRRRVLSSGASWTA